MADFDIRYDLPDSMNFGLRDLTFGTLLGNGAYRNVYELKLNPTYVIKYERTRTFCNAQEWLIWQEVQGTDLERWFAPCHLISQDGAFLIQQRTKPVSKLPAELPDFFADLKPENFGRLNGRLVAHDYGNHRIYTKGLHRWRMRKVS